MFLTSLSALQKMGSSNNTFCYKVIENPPACSSLRVNGTQGTADLVHKEASQKWEEEKGNAR